jgi:predicted naringenin-chalcone synthase
MTRLATLPVARRKQNTHAAILGLGCAAPPLIAQEKTLELLLALNDWTPGQRAWLTRVYLRSGIRTRGVVLAGRDAHDLEPLRRFYLPAISPSDCGPTTAARMGLYKEYAPPLAQSAAERALSDAQTDSSDITHLITASCTGFFAPGLDAELIGRLGLTPGVRRLHVGFMGCHAAFNALAAARDAVLADPKARVLVCCVELCSLHLAYGGWDPGKLVANALFADGAAAAVVGRARITGDGVWRLRSSSSELIPNSLDAMTWQIGDHGFEMTLSAGLPEIIRQNLRDWCEGWLGRHDLNLTDIAAWAIHPGGPKILDAIEQALDIAPEAMRASREVLARNGNMSSATILFILQQLAEKSRGPCVAIGLGPGLMAEGMLLHS